VHSHNSNCIYSIAKSNRDSIEFSLSIAEQKSSWLYSGLEFSFLTLIIQSLACAVCKDRSNYFFFNLLLESYEIT